MLQRIKYILQSNYFFWIILGVFIVQAAWIALSTVYPMMYDEAYHFGITEFFSSRYNLFVTDQPLSLDIYGDLNRGGSYLFHYLLSYPYRVFAWIGMSQDDILVVLRLMNVILFTSGLFVFKKLFDHIGVKAHVANTAILVFTVLPITTFLAAHINYDNLLFPLTGLSLIWLFKIIQNPENQTSIKDIVIFFIIGFFASLIKYTFLPILFAEVTVLLYVLVRRKKLKGAAIKTGLLKLNKLSVVVLAGLFLVLFGLFIERYAINAILYQKPIADCSINLSDERCMDFGPWGRNYNLIQQKPADFSADFMYFTITWSQHYFESIFTVGGGVVLQTGSMSVPRLAFFILLMTAAVLTTYYWHALRKENKSLDYLLAIFIFYVGVLIFQNYRSYLNLGQPVAQNARYLIPLMLPVLVFLCAGVFKFYAYMGMYRKAFAYLMIGLFFIGWSQGGGAFTYAMRSNERWYFEENYIQNTNRTIKNTLSPLIIESTRLF